MIPNDNLDQALARALDAVPHVDIADDFAARVLSRLPSARPARIALPDYLPALPSIGRRIALASAIVLFLAMFGLALAPAAPVIRGASEITCAAEFILLTVWLSLRPQPLR
jgi:hypothetical protein